jgi:hypothetical protein
MSLGCAGSLRRVRRHLLATTDSSADSALPRLRCAHARRQLRRRGPPGSHRPQHDGATAAQDAVDAWIAEHGLVCPGYGNQAMHWSSDLTADHSIPVAAGGAEDGALFVRCRSCNSGRGSRLY